MNPKIGLHSFPLYVQLSAKNKKSQQHLHPFGHNYTVGIYYNYNILYAKILIKVSGTSHAQIN